jgi:arylsulfatase A-like enzyme
MQLEKPLMYIALTGKFKSLESLPAIKKKLSYKKIQESFFSIYDIFSDENLINIWKSQPDYQDDINIIDKIYSAKLNYFDNELKDLFQLYGDKELQKNTIIILTGDHGEALMEHDILGHASNVYDETITHPLLVKFPTEDTAPGTKITPQFYQGTFTDISIKMMSGALNKENFIQELNLESDQNQNIISRNCSNSTQSVRQNNHWKYISDFKNNKKYLYDLTKDPKELTNIISFNEEIAEKLDLFLKLYRNKMNLIFDMSPCKINSLTKD